jgi:hypothetical protein
MRVSVCAGFLRNRVRESDYHHYDDEDHYPAGHALCPGQDFNAWHEMKGTMGGAPR